MDHSNATKQGRLRCHLECAKECPKFDRASKWETRQNRRAFTSRDAETSSRVRIGRPRGRARKLDKKRDKEARHRMQRPARRKEDERKEKREKPRERGRSTDGGRSRSENSCSNSSCKRRGPPDWPPVFVVSDLTLDFSSQ